MVCTRVEHEKKNLYIYIYVYIYTPNKCLGARFCNTNLHSSGLTLLLQNSHSINSVAAKCERGGHRTASIDDESRAAVLDQLCIHWFIGGSRLGFYQLEIVTCLRLSLGVMCHKNANRKKYVYVYLHIYIYIYPLSVMHIQSYASVVY